jgi:hypothetical protein
MIQELQTFDEEYKKTTEEYIKAIALNSEKRREIKQCLDWVKDPHERVAHLKDLIVNKRHYDYDYNRVFYDIHDRRVFMLDGNLYQVPTIMDARYKGSTTVHLTRLGMCIVYSAEAKLLLAQPDIKIEVLTAPKPCLNRDTGKLVNVGHWFNKITYPKGKTELFDICSLIFERDAKRMNLDIDYKLLEEMNK